MSFVPPPRQNNQAHTKCREVCVEFLGALPLHSTQKKGGIGQVEHNEQPDRSMVLIPTGVVVGFPALPFVMPMKIGIHAFRS